MKKAETIERETEERVVKEQHDAMEK